MSGTREGGLKTAATNKARHGENYYGLIGHLGGRISKTGGFASNKVGADGLTGKQRAMVAGVVGGSKSKRRKAKRV